MCSAFSAITSQAHIAASLMGMARGEAGPMHRLAFLAVMAACGTPITACAKVGNAPSRVSLRRVLARTDQEREPALKVRATCIKERAPLVVGT
jgi:hypothetical protein